MVFYCEFVICGSLFFSLIGTDNAMREYAVWLIIISLIVLLMFIYYSFLYDKKNNKFLTTYKILGVKKKHIFICEIIENIFIYAISILLGILLFDFGLRITNCLTYYDTFTMQERFGLIIIIAIIPVLNSIINAIHINLIFKRNKR